MEYPKLKVLVTAGSSWVAIDRVRVITSIFSGNTGLEIARSLVKNNFEVDLLLGQGGAKLTAQDCKTINITRYVYYEDIKNIIKKQLDLSQYRFIIHSAAIPDYIPQKFINEKIPSQLKNFTLQLNPTEKLVDFIRKKATNSFLVKFKLEYNKSEEELIAIAKESMNISKADMIIANNLDEMSDKFHKAFIIEKR